MAWMMDTYSMQVGYAVPEIVTGKPVALGGSLGRHEATGAGVVMVIERACERLGWGSPTSAASCRASATSAASPPRSSMRSARMIAVSDAPAACTTRAGSTSTSLLRFASSTAPCRVGEGDRIQRGAARAALRHPRPRRARKPDPRRERAPRAGADDRRGRERADHARGRRILVERGIPVLPDVLTNAGGVTVSYFEWVQDLGRLFWTGARSAQSSPTSSATPSTASGRSRSEEPDAAQRGARGRDPRGRRGAAVAGDLPMSASRVRDAMIPEPLTLDVSASAQEAGQHLVEPDVRAVYVSESGRFAGVLTRKTLVERVVAAGRDPREARLGEIVEPPNWTLDPDVPLDEAFGAARGMGCRARPGRGRTACWSACSRGAVAAAAAGRGRAAGRARVLSSRCRRRRRVALHGLRQLRGLERGAVEEVALARLEARRARSGRAPRGRRPRRRRSPARARARGRAARGVRRVGARRGARAARSTASRVSRWPWTRSGS